MAGTERLVDFPAKTTPVAADIIYVGDSADTMNEVKSTIAQIISGYSAGLASIAGLTTIANKMIYTTASNVYATTDLGAFGKSFLATADAAAGRALLVLVPGTDVQTQSAALSSIAGLTTAADKMIYTSAPNTYVVIDLTTRGRSILAAGTAIQALAALGLPVLTDGQLYIGSTGNAPSAATLTAGPGISIANASGAVTISGTGSGIGWTEVTGTTQAMTADNGYVANNASLVTLTLPTTAAFGTVINLVGKGAGLFKLAQNASQLVHVGSVATTTGTGGSITALNRYDSFELLCTAADTEWTLLGAPQGNLTIV